MSPTKFRGYNTQLKKWIYGDLLHCNKVTYIINDIENNDFDKFLDHPKGWFFVA